MKTLALKHSGIEVSALCLGILPFGTKPVLRHSEISHLRNNHLC
jgi:aryl-alcohol dehydrogenase-like predicted oxidoreductase